ncbi:MAG: hypothetical protein FJ109_21740, partial [Deltaproteobacteria bacterium]|nr:hypothetical protein [Deltaproteobacteria bacterium]
MRALRICVVMAFVAAACSGTGTTITLGGDAEVSTGGEELEGPETAGELPGLPDLPSVEEIAWDFGA